MGRTLTFLGIESSCDDTAAAVVRRAGMAADCDAMRLVHAEADGLPGLIADRYADTLRATEARSRGGLASQFDLETARRNAVLAQSTVIELQRERVTAWITLYRALGGGWTEPPATQTAQ